MFKKHDVVRNRSSKRVSLFIAYTPSGAALLLNDRGSEHISGDYSGVIRGAKVETTYEKIELSKEDYPKAWKDYFESLKQKRKLDREKKEYEKL